MRHLRFLSFLVLLSACGMTEDEHEDDSRRSYVTVPDPAFEEYLLRTYDLNGDGRISRYEAERVLTIDCAGLGIESLYGIDAFTSLRSLDCSSNSLTALDLTRIYQLEELDCSRNELILLRLGEQRGLRRLLCADNRLDFLDLEYAVSLSELDCAGNRLTTLDVSGCRAHMQSVDATGNEPLYIFYKGRNQLIDRLLLDGGVQIEER